jgi:hypothetical protein
MEIVQERLEREFSLSLITTVPTVEYHVYLTDGEMRLVENPSSLPDPASITRIEEPYVKARIMAPAEYIGGIMNLGQERRGEYHGMTYLDKERVEFTFDFPLGEIVLDFYDRLKSISRGYASLDYELIGFRTSPLVRLDMLINGDPIDAFSVIIHKDKAYEWGRKIAEKLKELIPRQLFRWRSRRRSATRSSPARRSRASARTCSPSATAATSRASASSSRSRRREEAHEAGRRVEIPQEAFLAVCRWSSPLATVLRLPNHLCDPSCLALPALGAVGRGDGGGAAVPVAARGAGGIPGHDGTGDRVPEASWPPRTSFVPDDTIGASCSRPHSRPPWCSPWAAWRPGAVPATDGRRLLLTDAIDAPLPTAQHRASLYHALVTGDGRSRRRCPIWPSTPHCADVGVRSPARTPRAPSASFPQQRVVPRWASERFAEVARRLAEGGHRVIVFGGPGEEARSRRVAGDVALDLGETHRPADARRRARIRRLVVTNDSGPMHLAAATGTTVVAIWGVRRATETGPLGAGPRIVRHESLPLHRLPTQMSAPGTGGALTFLTRIESAWRW